MMRPWYRSRLFWLGLPGLVFLLWCWWDSMQRWTEISLSWHGPPNGGPFGPPTEGCFLACGDGVLLVGPTYDPFAPVPGRLGIGLDMTRIPMDFLADPFAPEAELEPRSGFPAAWTYSKDDDPFSRGRLGVAIWWVVIVYAGVLAGVTAAWQRRKRRKRRHAVNATLSEV